jgi:hypothetical protein
MPKDGALWMNQFESKDKLSSPCKRQVKRALVTDDFIGKLHRSLLDTFLYRQRSDEAQKI